MPTVLKDTAAYETIEENLLAKKVTVDGRHVVVCYSPQTAERDLKMRGRALERLNEKLAAVKTAQDSHKAEAEVLAHRLFRRWVTRDTHDALVVSREKIATESQCDGTFVLETSNDTLSTAQVALGYKGLLRVERAWHSFKHSIDIQPVFLRKDERIAAHVTLCMITYLLERWAEIRSGISFRQIRQQLRTLHATELIQGDQRLWKPNRLAPARQALLKKLDIPAPKPVLHIGRLPRLPVDSM
jgi:transposase